MDRTSTLRMAVLCFVLGGLVSAEAWAADPQNQVAVDSSTASWVQYLHDQEKLAMDLNWEFLWMWDEPTFQQLGALERGQMDELLAWMRGHGLQPLVTSRSEAVYGDNGHLQAFRDLQSRGKASLLQAYLATAYMEEWDIDEIRMRLDGASDPSLLPVLTKVLAGAESHLQTLVSRIYGLGQNYDAQLLSQADVDEICAGIEPYSGSDFTLSAGLNDAWYYPFTSGQGFFITVYPDSQTVFLSWYTYDTELPGDGPESLVGAEGQRWLVAQGPFAGNRAELELLSSSGGLFDRVSPESELESVGFMTLQFEDCSRGSITYTLMTLFGGYMMPIERVASDNVGRCEVDSQM